ncbi:MAG: OmpA family protein [Bacteroidales bacterium]|nr:OmpA family protein [Bacteroidales bacterium]
MKKQIAFLIMLFVGISLTNAQSIDVQNVTIEVSVKNYDEQASEGEQILFVSKLTKAVYTGTSNADGEFTIKIPGADVYQIKIKGVGTNQDYHEMEIPALKENQAYGVYELDIMFEPPRVFTLNNVLFDTGSATIKPSSNKELKELFDYMSLKPDLKVEIAGHTDDVGEAESNLSLSQQRADAVRNWLIRRGISTDRVIAKGYGETQPVASNKSDEGKQKNRRTEVRILSN